MSPVVRAQRGAILVEFAVVALALYLLLGALLSFGTMIQAAQVAQDVARLAARELALTPLPAAITFEAALADTRDRIFDPNQLVVDLDAVSATGFELDQVFAAMPLVNRALRPVFVFDVIGTRRVLRFPGAVLASPEPTAFNAGLTVGVPLVVSRLDQGGEIVRWLPVVEEIRPDPNDPSTGSFSAAATGSDRGMVALRINIPATAAALAEYDAPATWPPGPNAGQPHRVGPVSSEPGSIPPYGSLAGGVPASAGPGPIAGELGLGELGALGQPVRPFRRVFLGQAFFRREAFQ
ncbi:MAG: pilus assembly protein [bacterium]|nr:pilus assembly protein [bacterium]